MYISFVCLYALFCWIYQVVDCWVIGCFSKHFHKVIVPILYVNFCTKLGAEDVQKE